MKIAVASDLHGSFPRAVRFFEAAEKLGAEKILLLGDLYYHGVRNPLPDGYDPMRLAAFLNTHKDQLIVVRGNCDSAVDATVSEFAFAESVVLLLGDKTVFCTHGDRFCKENLPVGRFDLLLYGHSHIGGIEKVGKTICANPGSISLPKGGTSPGFLLLTERELTLFDLSGTPLTKHLL